MNFPLFIYIKPPDDNVLQHVVPTVWWESNHVIDAELDRANKLAYHKSCEELQGHVKDMENLQVSSASPYLYNGVITS